MELLVGMLIAVSLYAVAVGPTKAYIERQKLQRCAENLRKLHLTLSLYANEHDGAYPQPAGARVSNDALAALVPRYSADASIFACPGRRNPDSAGTHVDYSYVTGLRKDLGADALILSDAQVNSEPKVRGAGVFSGTGAGPGSNHGKAGGNLVFVDGHLEAFGPATPRDLTLPPGAQILNPAQ